MLVVAAALADNLAAQEEQAEQVEAALEHLAQ